MTRGGKRRGAGRPPGSSVLDALEKWKVGVECQRRWHEDCKRRLAAEQRAYFDRSTYHADVSRVRKSGGRDPDARDDVEFSRREMAGISPDEEANAPRVVHFEVPRPYRLQRKIISEVAAWASEKFGKQVSEGVVESAWAIARKAEDEDV